MAWSEVLAAVAEQTDVGNIDSCKIRGSQISQLESGRRGTASRESLNCQNILLAYEFLGFGFCSNPLGNFSNFAIIFGMSGTRRYNLHFELPSLLFAFCRKLMSSIFCCTFC